jgi:hypothetical protein
LPETNKIQFGDWWIMHLHHTGLPPTANRYLKVTVSGNSFNKQEIILEREK